MKDHLTEEKFFTDLLINNEIMGQGVGFSKKNQNKMRLKQTLQRLGEIKWEKDTI